MAYVIEDIALTKTTHSRNGEWVVLYINTKINLKYGDKLRVINSFYKSKI